MSQVLQELEKSRKVIRQKYRKLKRIRGLSKQQVTRTLEPLITPLKNLVNLEIKQENGGLEEQREFKHSLGPDVSQQDENQSSGDLDDDTLDTVVEEPGDLGGVTSTPQRKPFSRLNSTQVGSLGARYMRELITSNDNDLSYGPRFQPETSKYTLGKLPFEVDEVKDIIHVGDKTFPGSVGLYELIFKARPKNVGDADKRTYAKIMQLSGLHLNNLDRIKSNKGEKYMKYIKNLRSLDTNDETIFHEAMDGSFSGGQLRAIHGNQPIRFVYWDDPNELVERLELLISEREAGHGGLDNEIISILEELKERGIIINSRKSSLFPAF